MQHNSSDLAEARAAIRGGFTGSNVGRPHQPFGYRHRQFRVLKPNSWRDTRDLQGCLVGDRCERDRATGGGALGRGEFHAGRYPAGPSSWLRTGLAAGSDQRITATGAGGAVDRREGGGDRQP